LPPALPLPTFRKRGRHYPVKASIRVCNWPGPNRPTNDLTYRSSLSGMPFALPPAPVVTEAGDGLAWGLAGVFFFASTFLAADFWTGGFRWAGFWPPAFPSIRALRRILPL